VELLGGRIWVESELDAGAAFIFEISVRGIAGAPDDLPPFGAVRSAADSSGAYARGEEAAAEAASNDGVLKGKRILIVEDVEINREIVEALIEHTGVAIDFAFDGGAAVRKFTAAPGDYDLILMDVHMPNVDGYEATALIRACGAPQARTTPIIAMTANVFREDVEKCLAAGMNDHLGKPIDADEVIAKLKHYLGSMKPAP
jgi:CheY-like chemotaxis protein